MTAEEAKERVLANTGAPATEKDFQPATKRQIMVRILRNLSSIAQNSGSSADALPYLDLMLAVEPDSAAHRLERARLRLQSGDPAGAREDFQWLLDRAPPGLDLDRIAEIYRSL